MDITAWRVVLQSSRVIQATRQASQAVYVKGAIVGVTYHGINPAAVAHLVLDQMKNEK
jgi:hypothetical protein